MISYQELKERCLGMTAFFETSNTYPDCYGVTAGNFDGAGLSHGVLQYNFGTGSLQPLWNHMNNNHRQICWDVFGSYYSEWADVLTRSRAEQIEWGSSITLQSNKHKVIEPWYSMFMALGTSEPSIAKQIEMSNSWFVNGERWFKALGLYSRRGYALTFDISVQMGRLLCQNVLLNDFRGISTAGKTRAQIEEEKLRIICSRISDGNNRLYPTTALPEMRQIVYNRKIAIVNGSNTWGFNIANYGLDYEPALEGGILTGGN